MIAGLFIGVPSQASAYPLALEGTHLSTPVGSVHRYNECVGAPAGRRLALLGDSVTYRSSLDLRAQLMAEGWSVCLLGVSSATTANVLDLFSTVGDADVIVMATGANDAVINLSQMPDQITRARSLVGQKPLIWVNLWMQRTAIDPVRAAHDDELTDQVNHLITVGTQRHLIDGVVDWNSFITARDGRSQRYLTDGLHTNSAGATARAHLISQVAQRFAS